MEEQKEEIIEETKDRKINVQQIIFLILTIIAIGALIFATITIIKYGAMLKNPLGYNLAQFKINSCSCIDNLGRFVNIFSINSTG
jgi:hypothetical protein